MKDKKQDAVRVGVFLEGEVLAIAEKVFAELEALQRVGEHHERAGQKELLAQLAEMFQVSVPKERLTRATKIIRDHITASHRQADIARLKLQVGSRVMYKDRPGVINEFELFLRVKVSFVTRPRVGHHEPKELVPI